MCLYSIDRLAHHQMLVLQSSSVVVQVRCSVWAVGNHHVCECCQPGISWHSKFVFLDLFDMVVTVFLSFVCIRGLICCCSMAQHEFKVTYRMNNFNESRTGSLDKKVTLSHMPLMALIVMLIVVTPAW